MSSLGRSALKIKQNTEIIKGEGGEISSILPQVVRLDQNQNTKTLTAMQLMFLFLPSKLVQCTVGNVRIIHAYLIFVA